MGEEWRSDIRRKGETPEEKKARKAAVKLGRKDARAAKKVGMRERTHHIIHRVYIVYWCSPRHPQHVCSVPVLAASSTTYM